MIKNKVIVHHPIDSAYCESNILYYKDILDISSAKVDYEMTCDFCEITEDINGDTLLYKPVYYPYIKHKLELVCPRCGTRYLFEPEITIHYRLKSCDDSTSPYYDSKYKPLMTK